MLKTEHRPDLLQRFLLRGRQSTGSSDEAANCTPMRILFSHVAALLLRESNRRRFFRPTAFDILIKVGAFLNITINIAADLKSLCNANALFAVIDRTQINGYPCICCDSIEARLPDLAQRTGSLGSEPKLKALLMIEHIHCLCDR